MNKTPVEAIKPFIGINILAYRDCASGGCTFKCTMIHCLYAIYYAMKFGWYDPSTFDVDEYENLAEVDNGDINWIIPNKFVAFSGPLDRTVDNKICKYNPAFYSDIFKEIGVYTFIRVNSPQDYDRQGFLKQGINHYDLNFNDGTSPPEVILRRR